MTYPYIEYRRDNRRKKPFRPYIHINEDQHFTGPWCASLPLAKQAAVPLVADMHKLVETYSKTAVEECEPLDITTLED